MTQSNTDYLPDVIRKEGLPVVKNNQQLHALVHSVFTPDKFNVLVPKALNIGERVKVAIRIVELDSNKDLKKNKHFWGFASSDEAIFSARAITKLAAEANVNFIPSKTGPTDSEYDKDGRPLRIRAHAEATTIDSLGNLRHGTGDYEWNYREDLANSKLTPDQKQQRRGFALQMAVTGAKKRAFFDCLGMDSSISRGDIGKPFIVPCVIDEIDYDDPHVKKLLQERALGVTGEVYGPGAVKAEFEVVDGQKVDKQTGEVADQKPAQNEPPASEAQPPQDSRPDLPPAPSVSEPSDAEKRQIFREEWNGVTSIERASKIEKLIDKAGVRDKYTEKNYASPATWSEKVQIDWIMDLAERVGEIPRAPEAKS